MKISINSEKLYWLNPKQKQEKYFGKLIELVVELHNTIEFLFRDIKGVGQLGIRGKIIREDYVMFVKYFIGGFFAKTVASFDDAITRIPIVAQLAKTRKERIAFSLGNLLAVTLAIIIAYFFSTFLEAIRYSHIITSVLIILLAIAVYFDLFEKAITKEVDIQREKMIEQVFFHKFFKLIVSGFIISFITLLDDIIVLTPVFLGSPTSDLYAILGIYASTILQLIVMVYFAKKISTFTYIKEMAIVGLLILALLVYLEVF